MSDFASETWLGDLAGRFERRRRELGIDPDPDQHLGASGDLTTGREQFDRFLRLPGMPEVCAILQAYSEIARLGTDPKRDFSFSCLPSNRRRRWSARAAVVCIGWTEALIVNVDHGAVNGWQVRVGAHVPKGVRRIVDDRPGGLDLTCYTNGLAGTSAFIQGTSAQQFSLALIHDAIRLALADAADGLRAFRNTPNDAWHNPFLRAWLADADVEMRREPTDDEIREEAPDEWNEDWNVTRPDATVLARARTSQEQARDLALRTYGEACGFPDCPVRQSQVLEAAHLTPHSLGGEESKENMRVLCANHHRAFDNRLVRWNSSTGRFEWAGDRPLF